jgi:retron-type reverse transcriptase
MTSNLLFYQFLLVALVLIWVDGGTRRLFEVDLENNLETLRQELKAGTFVPLPVRRTTIEDEERKTDGRLKERRLGIRALRDRIVQEGLRMILEPIYEADPCRRCGFPTALCSGFVIRLNGSWRLVRVRTRFAVKS